MSYLQFNPVPGLHTKYGQHLSQQIKTSLGIHDPDHECAGTYLHTDTERGEEGKKISAIHPIVIRLRPAETHLPQTLTEVQLFLLESEMCYF